MRKRFLVVGDIHFGYYPPELLYKEFQLILQTIENNSIDCVVIAGDYYDTKLNMSSAHAVYSVKAFSDLIKLCEELGIKVRQIKGTNSHDPENQLKNLAQIANSSKCDYKLYLTVDEEEIFPGMNVLYIPEEYMEDSKEYYKDYFNAGLLIMNLDQFRKQKFEEQFVEMLNKYKFVVQDQDYLNVICQGKVQYIDPMWNKSPCNPNVPVEDINLIHYKLIWKPWHAEVPYGDEFWKYADKTAYKDIIRNIRANYTQEQYKKDIENHNWFMDKIHNELNNPQNYYHLYLKPQQN